MRSKEAIRKAQSRYEASTIVRKVLKLHTSKDADILAYLDKQSNINGTIKELLREQIKREE